MGKRKVRAVSEGCIRDVFIKHFGKRFCKVFGYFFSMSTFGC